MLQVFCWLCDGPQFCQGGRSLLITPLNSTNSSRSRYVYRLPSYPQIDRTKPAHQQEPPDLYAGIVEERDDGVIIRGAQMLERERCWLISSNSARSTPCGRATRIMQFRCSSLQCARCKNFSGGPTRQLNSVFDYPLSRVSMRLTRCLFDDVFVPWERVFVYKMSM